MDIREIKLAAEQYMGLVAKSFDKVLKESDRCEMGIVKPADVAAEIEMFNLRMKRLRYTLTEMANHVHEVDNLL